ncbi:sigma-54-dependent Fis family transcriptional regulator [Aneurinibacillus tyrosinisolvens]|uniref:sigma-54-dependent Fis family transcriptional regulator n=1 Tax=Aneurinibacillus tyrosinisolvens TaxID=1443435 RepID=UPI00069C6541|nr:sigma-54-dependent Fis family transcriptional regulator [Aneurinibacillus tyrosinisolvens]
MKPKIAIVGHPLVRPMCINYIQEKGMEDYIVYYEATFGNLKPTISQLESEKNIDVIVTGWGHRTFLHELGIPIVIFKVTGLDILEALTKAKKLGQKVVCMRYGAPFEVIERYSNLVDMEIVSSFYLDEQDAEEKIEKYLSEGYRTFIGTSLMYDLVNVKGGNGIYIYSNDSVSNALENGWQLALGRRTEIEKAEQFRIILEHSQEGIIAINDNNICSMVNTQAEKMLNLSRDYFMHKSIDEFWPVGTLKSCLETGDSRLQVIEKVNQRKFLVDYIPTLVNERVSGVIVSFQDIAIVQKAEQKIRKDLHKKGHIARHDFSDIVGKSKTIHNAVTLAKVFSKNESTVLITGESGSGKELFAQSIHKESLRRLNPFVAINCAALPESLLESELFGYEDGAFTGAKKGGREGLFEAAHKGTIFLDEIGEISLDMQARLLRVLQEKEMRRVGGQDLIHVDVRIIAATNRELKKMVEEGGFRQDLYYRLNVLHLSIPPLRERIEDLEHLANYFCIKHQASELFQKISNVIKNKLSGYHWPGNVRELENIIERLIVIFQNQKEEHHELLNQNIFQDLLVKEKNNKYGYHSILDEGIRDTGLLNTGRHNFEEQKKLAEKEMILKVLKQCNGNKSEAARFLGMSRSTFWRKLKA